MTTATAPVSATATANLGRPGMRWAIADAVAVTGRNLRGIRRQPQLLVFSTIQPVMFVLLFNYVFGGAILLPPGVEYINFLLPGIFAQTVAFGSTQTAVGLADDVGRGMIDRFRSLPMARSAVLAGRTLSDVARNLFVVLLMTLVGSLIGFRFQAGVVPAIGAVVLVVAFGFALSWVFAFVGMSVKGSESAQAASFVGIFPLVFASSIFVPTDSMPGWLQAFAKASPVTNTVNAVRAMALGGPTARPLLYSILWILGILAVFVPLAVSRYRRLA